MAERPVLMLLPGLLCDGSIFAEQIAGLADIAEVRTLDFRGFDSIDAMAKHVLAQAPERFALAGFSMGGRVSFQIMRLASERVSRLCLFDTGATPEPAGGAEKRKPLVDLAYREGMEALAAQWLPPMLGPDAQKNPAIVGPLTQMVCRFSPLDHEKQIKALVERPDARDMLAKIACPTAVIVGAQDGWSTPDQHREMAAQIRGASLTIIEGAGHFVSVEQPAAFTQALRAWLSAPAA